MRDIYCCAAVVAKLFEHYHGTAPRGFSTGWKSLDEFYTVRRGELTVITGIPSHGKSEFLDALVLNLMVNHGYKFSIFSPENYPLEMHLMKLYEKFIGKPFRDHQHQTKMTEEEIIDCSSWFNDKLYFISPEKDTSFKKILELAEETWEKYGINGFVVDPYNEIEHKRPTGMNETEYISQLLSQLRWFARKRNVNVWIVAHPAKMIKDRNGDYPVPTPYDISGSSHWRNKADCCITVWRNLKAEGELKNTVEIHVQKVRFKFVGKIGVAALYWDYVTGRFSEEGNSLESSPYEKIFGGTKEKLN